MESCIVTGAACELLLVRGSIDLEAGCGVSALDLHGQYSALGLSWQRRVEDCQTFISWV